MHKNRTQTVPVIALVFLSILTLCLWNHYIVSELIILIFRTPQGFLRTENALDLKAYITVLRVLPLYPYFCPGIIMLISFYIWAKNKNNESFNPRIRLGFVILIFINIAYYILLFRGWV